MQMRVPGVPFSFVPSAADVWRIDERTGTVAAEAAPRTDIFIDPRHGATANAESTLNAATLLGEAPPGDFQFSARVTVEFAAAFDAGVLLIWADEQRWAKLCFEVSPAGEPMVVSVVCRDVADDANAFVVAQPSVWLRVSRVDRAYAYHASLDGRTWQLVRFFNVYSGPFSDRIGFEVQSPTGDGCGVRFDDIRFAPVHLAELRDGS
jgi:uncharacterized protein